MPRVQCSDTAVVSSGISMPLGPTILRLSSPTPDRRTRPRATSAGLHKTKRCTPVVSHRNPNQPAFFFFAPFPQRTLHKAVQCCEV